MNGVLDDFREDVDANWKMVIENSLEGYHVPAVHSEYVYADRRYEPGAGLPRSSSSMMRDIVTWNMPQMLNG